MASVWILRFMAVSAFSLWLFQSPVMAQVPCTGGPATYTCTDEAAYLAKLAEVSTGGVISEGFEDDAVWGSARFPLTAQSVLSQGVRWSSNYTANGITTGDGQARSGAFGVFSFPHGNVTGAPFDAQRDGFIGQSEAAGTLTGVGGWLSTNTPGASVRFLIDDQSVDFNDPAVTGIHAFFGVIRTAGFTRFEVYESHGTVQDQKFIFGDDFSICAAVGPTRAPFGDTDGDGRSDITVWRASSRVWYGLRSNTPGSYAATEWGLSTDMPVPGDYDGDGKMDFAVWRPSTGVWYVLPSGAPGTFLSTQWGQSGDVPVPGDYDGDRTTDVAVWRASSGVWYGLRSTAPGSYSATVWGLSTDMPVPGDYDFDGRTDIAVWRPGTGVWYVLPSNAPGTFTSTPWGLISDLPVPGDYDGDGKTDIAVWRTGSGVWYVLSSAAPGTFNSVQWGLPTDTPAAGDYDGDGNVDIAVWRSGNGVWYILPSGAPGTFTSMAWGMAGDIPISALTTILGSIP